MSNDKRKDYKREREKYFKKIEYKMCKFDEFDYSILQKIPYVIRKGNGKKDTYNDCLIMLDTETSKTSELVETSKVGTKAHRNIVVMFTLSIRLFNKNIVTLWGHKPSECVKMLEKIIENLQGEKTCIYIHNLPYDWTFLRKFIMTRMGTPTKQLNIKSHYPIYIEFDNGMILRDSLILAQRKLEKWAIDMDVEHKKAVGFWDYDKIRNQNTEYTKEELIYSEFDTLAGVECLQKLKDMLNKQIYAMPWTATGIPREECRKRGKQDNARDLFLKIAPQNIELYTELEKVYHGGYTHANRYFVDEVMR